VRKEYGRKEKGVETQKPIPPEKGVLISIKGEKKGQRLISLKKHAQIMSASEGGTFVKNRVSYIVPSRVRGGRKLTVRKGGK